MIQNILLTKVNYTKKKTGWDMNNKKTEMPETDTKAVEVNAFLSIFNTK